MLIKSRSLLSDSSQESGKEPRPLSVRLKYSKLLMTDRNSIWQSCQQANLLLFDNQTLSDLCRWILFLQRELKSRPAFLVIKFFPV